MPSLAYSCCSCVGPSSHLGMRSDARKVSIVFTRYSHPHRCSFLSTQTSSNGLKTRNFGTIIAELTSCLRVHAECDSKLNGVSLEFTGELNEDGFSVTECLGGSMELSEEELPLRYQVRLSYEGRNCADPSLFIVVLRPEIEF